MRLVIIESPYSPSNGHAVEHNLAYLRAVMRDCLLRGESPYASHGLYTQPGVLDDAVPSERELGMEAGFAWRWAASATVICLDLGNTLGMVAGENLARQMGQPVEYRWIGEPWSDHGRTVGA